MEVRKQFQDQRVCWGTIWSYNFRNDPKRLPFVLSRYKFAAKMAGRGRSILEMGCGEGIGAPILAEHAVSYTGIDYDEPQIEAAKRIFSGEKFHFLTGDFFERSVGCFDSVVSLDVIEHIYKEHEERYVEALCAHLNPNGIAVVGTPNETTAPYASALSRAAHVNLYSQERLRTLLLKYFTHVFCFGMNDEVVHTGYAPMAHYLICLACTPKLGVS